MSSDIRELVEFLSSNRPDVREAAVEVVLGLTANDSGLKTLLQEEKEHRKLLKSLCRMLSDVRLVAEGAIKALINLTASDPSFVSLAMLEHDIINRVMNQLEEKSWRLKNLSLMILANVTVSSEGSNAVVSDRVMGEALLTRLTHWFMTTDPEPEGTDSSTSEPTWDDEFQYVAHILANITQIENGRSFLWQQPGSITLIEALLPQLRSPNVIRRRGICNMFRNLAFEAQYHQSLIDNIGVIPKVLFLLAGPEVLSEEDKIGMDESLLVLGTKKCRERDLEVRSAVVDTLLLLCVTRIGRERCRSAKVYPIIRDAHLVEADDEVGEQIYKLVGLLMRDEEGEGPDWSEIAKKSYAPEQDAVNSLRNVANRSNRKAVVLSKSDEPEEEIPENVVSAIEDFNIDSGSSEEE